MQTYNIRHLSPYYNVLAKVALKETEAEYKYQIFIVGRAIIILGYTRDFGKTN